MRIERDEVQTAAIIAALIAAFVFGLYLPHRKKVAQTEAQITTLQAQLQADPNDTRHLVALVEEVESLKQSLTGAQQYVPPQSELAELLKQLSADLESIGSEGGPSTVTGQETQTRAIANYSNYSVLPVGMRFQTTFASAFNFLERIESMQRLVRIDVLEMSWNNQPERRLYRDVPLDVRMSLSAFFSPAAAIQGTVE